MMFTDNRKSDVLIHILFGTSVIFLYLFITHLGIGIGTDSFSYFGMARDILDNIRHGVYWFKGISTHFPPLYPLLLSLFHVLGLSLPQSAKLLGGIVFIIDAYLFYITAYKKTHSYAIAIIASYIVIFTFIVLFDYALTEPIFYMFLALFILLIQSEKDNSIWFFLVLTLAPLLRYAGISLFFTYIVWVLFKYRSKDRERRIFYAVLTIIPTLLYMFSGEGVGAREFSFKVFRLGSFFYHLLFIPFKVFISLNDIPLLPLSYTYVKLFQLFCIFLVLFAIYLPFIRKFNLKDLLNSNAIKERCLKNIVCIFIIIYSGFIIFSRMFVDGIIPADRRIFSPLSIALVLDGFPALLYENRRSILTKIYVLTVLIIGIAASYKLYSYGIGFVSMRYRQSETLKRFINIDKMTHNNCYVYSNIPEVIGIYAKRHAEKPPRSFLLSQGKPNPYWKRDIKDINSFPGCKIFVYFKGGRWFVVNVDSLIKYLNSQNLKVIKSNDGTIVLSE